MNETDLTGIGINSNRILLSDKHFHDVTLSEQSMGVIGHALDVLGEAFSLEPDYYELIQRAKDSVRGAFEGTIIHYRP